MRKAPGRHHHDDDDRAIRLRNAVSTTLSESRLVEAALGTVKAAMHLSANDSVGSSLTPPLAKVQLRLGDGGLERIGVKAHNGAAVDAHR